MVSKGHFAVVVELCETVGRPALVLAALYLVHFPRARPGDWPDGGVPARTVEIVEQSVLCGEYNADNTDCVRAVGVADGIFVPHIPEVCNRPGRGVHAMYSHITL